MLIIQSYEQIILMRIKYFFVMIDILSYEQNVRLSIGNDSIRLNDVHKYITSLSNHFNCNGLFKYFYDER